MPIAEIEKTMEYKVLELLISEFCGQLDVTSNVREYSRLLYRYVRRNKLDEGIENNYEVEIAEKLYKDKAAMEIVSDYLWENSSNKEGDGIQPLAVWNFNTFSLMQIRGA